MIGDALARWREAIRIREDGQLESYIESFLGSTGHVATMQRLSPDLYDEVIGIAAGSNEPEQDVLAFNLMDEDWRFARSLDTGCSMIGVTLPDHTIMVGQNMDLPSSMAGSQVLLRIRESGQVPEQLVLSSAGLIGLLGVNSAGVSCCVNTLFSLPGSPDGLPVSFVVRELLRRRDSASAADYLAQVPHASGQHYALADPSSVRGYECSADGCVEGPVADVLCHTNHPLWRGSKAAPAEPPSVDEGSLRRLRALENGLGDVQQQASLRGLLSSHDDGLCVRPTEDVPVQTFCSAQFILTSPPQVRVALGRPDISEWIPVEWSAPAPDRA